MEVGYGSWVLCRRGTISYIGRLKDLSGKGFVVSTRFCIDSVCSEIEVLEERIPSLAEKGYISEVFDELEKVIHCFQLQLKRIRPQSKVSRFLLQHLNINLDMFKTYACFVCSPSLRYTYSDCFNSFTSFCFFTRELTSQLDGYDMKQINSVSKGLLTLIAEAQRQVRELVRFNRKSRDKNSHKKLNKKEKYNHIVKFKGYCNTIERCCYVQEI